MPESTNPNKINDVFSYIMSEELNYKTARVPLTRNKDWNMREHIERCTAVANGYYYQGLNDGIRPYDDIVTPVINVAFRSEGFDVKDIVPYVEDVEQNYKSFLVKKFHPQWARKNELDTFIDDVVETSIIYDLVLVKNINNVRPEVVDLKTIAFCDQSDIMAGPICIEHQYTPAELDAFRGKWDSDAIDRAISLAVETKEVTIANNRTVKTPGKYVKVYELRGHLPATWLDGEAEMHTYTDQMWIVCFYHDNEGNKQGIVLYNGKDKPLSDNFKALKIDKIRARGRACGRSIVETLFEPQVWNNYSAIKLKQMMDSAITIFQTDSDEYKNQKLTELKTNTVISHETGKPITKVDGTIQNVTLFTNHQAKMQNDARVLGSASEGSLGVNPASGTPFALENLVVQQGQGFHEYRQGKIATFFADVLYRDWILQYLVNEMSSGVKFSEELSLDEMIEVSRQIAENRAEAKVKEKILAGEIVTEQTRQELIQKYTDEFKKGGNRKFFETVKGELKDVPLSVMVNVAGKQKNLAKDADKLSNFIANIIKNPQAIAQIPGLGKLYNELLEDSGLSPVDFSKITTPIPVPNTPSPNQSPSLPTQPPTDPNQLQAQPPVGVGQ
jgi:hypothetical protein